MFIARFCDLLEVEVNCDGCSVTLPGRRYRCLQCTDMDLCTTCYSGEHVQQTTNFKTSFPIFDKNKV